MYIKMNNNTVAIATTIVSAYYIPDINDVILLYFLLLKLVAK